MPVRQRVSEGGRDLLVRSVRASDDRRLERLHGSRPALRLLFTALACRFDVAAAAGFAGAVQLELRTVDGGVRPWAIEIGTGSARARPGRAETAALTIRVGLADFLRIAAGELDAGRALLGGRLDVQGDFALLTRLGPMFGAGALV